MSIEIKKLQFSSGTDVTAPSDLTAVTSSTRVTEYVDDAAYVAANGTAEGGDVYINTTLKALRLYTGSSWRTVIMVTDDADPTKTFLVDVDGATTGTSATLDFNQTASRVYTFPDTAGIVVVNSNTLTSPTLVSGATGTTTIGNASGTVVFPGSIQVTGTTTTVSSTNLVVADKNIFINSGGNDAASEGAGLTVDRTGTDGSLIYKDASATKFAAGALASEVDLVGTSSTQTLTNKTISGASNTISNVNLASQVTGLLPFANGGLGANHANANAALNTLLPSQATNATKYLQTDGTNTSWVAVTGGSSSTDPRQARNYSLACSVGASALTIALKNGAGNDATALDPVEIAFRNATSATGTYSVIQTTAAQSIVVTSGATLGHTSAVATYFYVYQINNAGTSELAVSTKLFDDGSIVSTTVMNSSSDSASVMYSTTARTNVACRLIGRLLSNQTTAGTYAAVPTEISLGQKFVNDPVKGRSDGLASFAGDIGEVISATISANYTFPVTTAGDVTGASITLTAGTWLIMADLSMTIGSINGISGFIQLANSSNITINNCLKSIESDIGSSKTIACNTSMSAVVNISSSTAYKLRAFQNGASGDGDIILLGTGNGLSSFFAVRIA